MNDLPGQISATLDTLPNKPGCYIYTNADGTVIYVGKAINLRHRVRSYFQGGPLDFKTRQLVKAITKIDWIVVESELEALILEMNLIKRHRPRFNIRLKDDKRYPYIKVAWSTPFPKVSVTRQMVQDGSRYFGPYTSVWAVHQTLDVLRRIFPYLTCDREITGKDPRACLYYDIHLCSAPCIGAIDQASYREMISHFCDFLEGNTDKIVKRLESEMHEAADALQFEKARQLRDQIQSIQRVVEKQRIISDKLLDSDVIAMARADGEACVQIFFVRSGKLIGREYFILEGTHDEDDQAIIGQFLKQFYSEAASIPPRLLLPQEVEEAKIIEQWLRTKREKKVELVVARRGENKKLVEMAAENATETLSALRAQWEADTNKQQEALAEIQQALNLGSPPNRIECFDISNTQGTALTASMVVFEQGTPSKRNYRRFNIKTVEGPDDFASMEEALTRRFKRWQAAQEALQEPSGKVDTAFSILPDLLIVDGGKGQLGRAVQVLEQFQLTNQVPVVGLAKQHEELFLPQRSRSIQLPRNSQGLFLVQRIRDEAHRFAITAHRNRRTREGMASVLDRIPGIGPARRKWLLTHFGSVDAIRKATVEELTAAPGITPQIAHSILEHIE